MRTRTRTSTRRRLALLLGPALLGLSLLSPFSSSAATTPALPQGTQTDAAYAASQAAAHVTNVLATAQQTSCYRPEVPYTVNSGPAGAYSGMTPCPASGATTGEDTGAAGPYATQAGSNPGYPAATPMLVKGHSESDLRVDPTDPNHLIGASKWVVSAEGYNHLLGFFESHDGGRTWPVQGHIPGYEGWTDNTDPVGAFDTWGNYYSLLLPYQFFYNADGSHDFSVGTAREANPAVPSQAISLAVRPHGATAATQWTTTHNGRPDYLATYDSIGNGPDKQWITIDTTPGSPHLNRVYAMWVDFHDLTPVPYVSYADARPDGTHTDWSAPQALPEPPSTPQGATYLLPHVAPDGTVYTTLTNSDPAHKFCCTTIFLDASHDGGRTWSTVSTVRSGITPPPGSYANTTFRDGIEDTFTLGTQPVNGHYPLYSAYEDYGTGVVNVLLTASYDGGASWSAPIRVNDNAAPADEFQPNLTTGPDGTVSVAFYDRRLPCPAAGTPEAAAAGLALDTANAKSPGVAPYGAADYCVNTSIQFYDPTLNPVGHNIRLSAHAFDPQLDSPVEGSSTFIGDYFGNTIAGTADYTTSVSTYDDGTNPNHLQQQLVTSIRVPRTQS
ncbi:sialidase family protein [Streptomyces sp. SP17BM10]|uniref:sialidase family protein n=1 Tax=Streptomyces sp. SP17BM10 TaxID=3002530 RepID=UPI002E7820E1|nr:sialidase family protein [Streptomyces sp. SP17BM10]MEE1786172.1 sialidase family protein [Streptomyces sp. SP17BM10]